MKANRQCFCAPIQSLNDLALRIGGIDAGDELSGEPLSDNVADVCQSGQWERC